ncbi:MAG: hypothetical protein ACREDL_19285 [Bradyrhizobium sp.]
MLRKHWPLTIAFSWPEPMGIRKRLLVAWSNLFKRKRFCGNCATAFQHMRQYFHSEGEGRFSAINRPLIKRG